MFNLVTAVSARRPRSSIAKNLEKAKQGPPNTPRFANGRSRTNLRWILLARFLTAGLVARFIHLHALVFCGTGPMFPQECISTEQYGESEIS